MSLAAARGAAFAALECYAGDGGGGGSCDLLVEGGGQLSTVQSMSGNAGGLGAGAGARAAVLELLGEVAGQGTGQRSEGGVGSTSRRGGGSGDGSADGAWRGWKPNGEGDSRSAARLLAMRTAEAAAPLAVMIEVTEAMVGDAAAAALCFAQLLDTVSSDAFAPGGTSRIFTGDVRTSPSNSGAVVAAGAAEATAGADTVGTSFNPNYPSPVTTLAAVLTLWEHNAAWAAPSSSSSSSSLDSRFNDGLSLNAERQLSTTRPIRGSSPRPMHAQWCALLTRGLASGPHALPAVLEVLARAAAAAGVYVEEGDEQEEERGFSAEEGWDVDDDDDIDAAGAGAGASGGGKGKPLNSGP